MSIRRSSHTVPRSFAAENDCGLTSTGDLAPALLIVRAIKVKRSGGTEYQVIGTHN